MKNGVRGEGAVFEAAAEDDDGVGVVDRVVDDPGVGEADQNWRTEKVERRKEANEANRSPQGSAQPLWK